MGIVRGGGEVQAEGKAGEKWGGGGERKGREGRFTSCHKMKYPEREGDAGRRMIEQNRA